MTNAFPTLMALGLLAPFIIRIVAGAAFLHLGAKRVRVSGYMKGLGILEIIGGALLILGLWTQVAALVLSIILVVKLIQKIDAGKFLSAGVNYYILLLALTLSLVLTGAGFLAFDLPL
jgi:uncharacterized membrane protein YphA (DoxX/SURF4 family)